MGKKLKETQATTMLRFQNPNNKKHAPLAADHFLAANLKK